MRWRADSALKRASLLEADALFLFPFARHWLKRLRATTTARALRTRALSSLASAAAAASLPLVSVIRATTSIHGF